ncbi:MAG: deoxyribodipyrimidine photo-lyase [Hyphomonadaceae bacterium]
MPDQPVIFWFRDDLRLNDNPGLTSAVQSAAPLVLLYLLDERSPGVRPLGGAARWWLDKSLRALSEDIGARGGELILRRGSAEDEVNRLIRETGARSVIWNRRYGPARQTDQQLKTVLAEAGVEAQSFNGSVLVEPFALKTGAGSPFKVFTPFWKALCAAYDPPPAMLAPRRLTCVRDLPSDRLDDWELHPSRPDWSAGLAEAWRPGETAALERLTDFLTEQVAEFPDQRDIPGRDATSRLSPYLRFGEVSPAHVWRAARAAEAAGASSAGIDKFLSELAWRDFSWSLLYHDPEMGRLSWRRSFESVAWRDPPEGELNAWRRGRTGFPIVDAGMRQLWSTGWMHNRVRMIVASFLTKDILAHWRVGEDWFWDTLVDADEANNAAGWQWTAGTGADAAPYFRVFNPIAQGERFDPDGAYIRRWVPELAHLPAKQIHRPIEAGAEGTEAYPAPMLDHAGARLRALEAFAAAKT